MSPMADGPFIISESELLTVRQAAHLLGLKARSTDTLLRRRKIPVADRVGPVMRFRRSDILWLGAHMRGPGRPRKS